MPTVVGNDFGGLQQAALGYDQLRANNFFQSLAAQHQSDQLAQSADNADAENQYKAAVLANTVREQQSTGEDRKAQQSIENSLALQKLLLTAKLATAGREDNKNLQDYSEALQQVQSGMAHPAQLKDLFPTLTPVQNTRLKNLYVGLQGKEAMDQMAIQDAQIPQLQGILNGIIKLPDQTEQDRASLQAKLAASDLAHHLFKANGPDAMTPEEIKATKDALMAMPTKQDAAKKAAVLLQDFLKNPNVVRGYSVDPVAGTVTPIPKPKLYPDTPRLLTPSVIPPDLAAEAKLAFQKIKEGYQPSAVQQLFQQRTGKPLAMFQRLNQ